MTGPDILPLLGDLPDRLRVEGCDVRHHGEAMPDVLGVERDGRHATIVAMPDGSLTVVMVRYHEHRAIGLAAGEVGEAVRGLLRGPAERERDAVIAHLRRRAARAATPAREEAFGEAARAIERLEHLKEGERSSSWTDS